ncbi:hypothetical protein EGT42_14620 [Acinetobacter haemolyticus]|nr:hypothetical protein EGT42_14620 [Acinetobacter haemolyticus]
MRPPPVPPQRGTTGQTKKGYKPFNALVWIGLLKPTDHEGQQGNDSFFRLINQLRINVFL